MIVHQVFNDELQEIFDRRYPTFAQEVVPLRYLTDSGFPEGVAGTGLHFNSGFSVYRRPAEFILDSVANSDTILKRY